MIESYAKCYILRNFFMYIVVYIYEHAKETGLFGGNMKLKFQTVYEEHKNSIYGYLLYMTKDAQLAEDLSQETFLKIFLGLGRFKEECNVKTWVLKIARNTFVTYARKKRPELLEEQQYELVESETPESIVIKKEEGKQVQKILMSLNEEDRTILLLRDYEKLSYEEIAQILQVNIGIVKSRLYRARQKFRTLYEEKEYKEGSETGDHGK